MGHINLQVSRIGHYLGGWSDRIVIVRHAATTSALSTGYPVLCINLFLSRLDRKEPDMDLWFPNQFN